ncbi:bifunctional histidinal dehydrogenase/ histidinol dehydrogenase [Corynebacterium imitans]|uniref:Histidinol dehydrogenase n=1 Tax=Corynebacterium imitans TaxID=156978 RepID=A0A076NSE0_9CORY|nr:MULTISPECIES: histidinol dehydrogenase [Corynebacterium]AIJ33852.1 histidinol dehydrogenase [Corynebacterium imitans]MDK8305709.1 histidinol dehydrogenase [Corynebacterium imitans]MDK8636825.1 histidinol dehydrogenase [Corynebacterium imitans]MDK8772440.1 histidinol dehydrogenase [Corynebacterium imitans]OHF36218.1 histidinol dehydrogenase [Corynebacterium sp. HMSC074A01]
MLHVTDLRGRTPSTSELRRVLPRGGTDVNAVLPTVTPIVEAVREGGAATALDYGEQFDHVRPTAVRVPAEVIQQATDALDSAVRDALEVAIARIRKVHEEQKPQSHTTRLAETALVTEKFIPVNRVGLYVPGGKAVYPSSVLMNVIPAQAAGASSLVVCTPPQEEFGGWPHPTTLAACQLLGVDEVWAVGGAQAVALMAYGDDECGLEPVDMVTGPGNIFVTAAKRVVNGIVGIDAEAGPSEIAVIADEHANAEYVALDLISQAEHDEQAASVLITDSEDFAARVDALVEERSQATINAERARSALGGKQSGIVLVSDLDAAIDVANAYAAEHLEIHTENPREVAERIINAGAIFVGPYSPVPLGDYAAGSNHVLPTSGTARFSAGLSTHTFLKPVNLIEYDRKALQDIGAEIIALATDEQLPAHGESIRARMGKES